MTLYLLLKATVLPPARRITSLSSGGESLINSSRVMPSALRSSPPVKRTIMYLYIPTPNWSTKNWMVLRSSLVYLPILVTKTIAWGPGDDNETHRMISAEVSALATAENQSKVIHRVLKKNWNENNKFLYIYTTVWTKQRFLRFLLCLKSMLNELIGWLEWTNGGAVCLKEMRNKISYHLFLI